MASVSSISFLICILVLQACSASSFNFSSIFGGICKAKECGKGTCRDSNDSTLGFVCDCDPGWKQARPKNDTDLQFLPCVIPNCTLNNSCVEAPSPAPPTQKPANGSMFDPCFWADCGGGTCHKTSPITHTCDCKQGYYNILNVTAFPCYRDCAIGMDCKNLGIGLKNNSTSSPLADNGQSQATSITSGHLSWMKIFSLLFLSLVLYT